ncbi:HTTM domain-containing protein [Halovivax cerinus]|uniref:HTTM domain-containing protein n=1 Tax=Halovivax cerinus TaxID=1487865 RepID=A0ABD5NLY9_9EURY|nr:HTTM domain-containing protein [Halovivax cerinus]
MKNRRTRPGPTGRRAKRTIEWCSEWLASRFAIDRRALAAFRIGLGGLLLVDLALRSRWLGAFYTDDGVLPRRALFSDYAAAESFFTLSGEPWAIALFFGTMGVAALAMVVGYRTRVATILSWLFLLALHARNPMILNGGDNLFLMLFFWGMFLPLGDRWSIDALRSREATSTSATSVATMAVLLQVVLMYVTNAIHKSRSDLWMDGEAVAYVMQADQFTIFLGNHIAEWFVLLRAVTLAWLVLLAAAPLLLVCSGTPRAVLASLFAGMHVGMLATMRLGIFPLVVVVAVVPFYQTVVWDGVERLASRVGAIDQATNLYERHFRRLRPEPDADEDRPGHRVTPDEDRPDPSATVGVDGPRSSVATEGARQGRSVRDLIDASVDRGSVVFSTVIPWVFVVLVVLSNAQAVEYTEVPDPAEEVLDSTKMEQTWRMFAPNPVHTTNWFVAAGELENGTTVDVIHGGQVQRDRPDDIDARIRSARWRKYFANVYQADNENHRSYLANHLCGSWNRSHETNVDTVTVYRGYERTTPHGGSEASGEVTLVEYDCSGPFVQRGD